MKLKDKLINIVNVQIDTGFVAQLERAYGVLPIEVKRLVSLNKETISYDDFSLLRSLSHAEITDASSDMAVDFIGKGLLPLFDVGDNDYIVYDVAEKTWCRFNIVDEVKFSISKTITELL